MSTITLARCLIPLCFCAWVKALLRELRASSPVRNPA